MDKFNKTINILLVIMGCILLGILGYAFYGLFLA